MNSSSEKGMLLRERVMLAIEAVDEATHEEYENVTSIIAMRIHEEFYGLRGDQTALMYDIVEEIGVKYAVIVASMVPYAYSEGSRPEDEIPKVMLLHALADYNTASNEIEVNLASVH